MEQITDSIAMLDLMTRPAFGVKDGIITKVSNSASNYMIQVGEKVTSLLETGAEEYESFHDGCLYLTLNIQGHILGASVIRMAEFDVFCLSNETDNTELRAMALAAQELREPMSSIMATTERLFPMTGLKNDPAVQEQINQINRGLFQMLRVMGNMSDAGRYTADQGHYQEIRDVCALVDETFEKITALLEHTSVTLTYESLSTPIFSLVDSEKLERAIFNIVSNALKFTPKGGHIDAKLAHRGNKLYLSVQDNGSGIDSSLRGNLFTRYTRDPGLEDSRFGIGLGMVLIRAAASVHGGTVLIDQPAGVGTRITMSFSIRQNTHGRMRSPVFHMDYTGERDHGLIELSQFLPAYLYES